MEARSSTVDGKHDCLVSGTLQACDRTVPEMHKYSQAHITCDTATKIFRQSENFNHISLDAMH